MTVDTRILGTPPSAGTAPRGFPVDRLPESLAGYTLIGPIGQGGMGSVYEVCHPSLGKRFALKLLSESLRDNTEAIDRFRSETLALGKLEHPNIVLAVDAGIWNGRPFLVTELLKGQDLASRVTNAGRLDVDSVITIAIQLARALSFAHDHGYFHRDIKPSNIFYQPDGTAKLLDFGLVRSEANQSLTQAGCLMGTVDFIAPEQACNASQANTSSDIYSLGCTLIYLLSGEVPFPDRLYPSLPAKLQAHLHALPRWLAEPNADLPSWLIALLRAMVAKTPSDRPANCHVIAASLQNRRFTSELTEPIAPCHTAATPAAFRLRTAQKAAIGSAVAIMLSVAAWPLLGTRSVPTTFSPTATSELPQSLSDEDGLPTNSHSESQPPVTPSKANRREEKTLPVSITHNARGTSLPGMKQLMKSAEPSVFRSKDAGHE